MENSSVLHALGTAPEWYLLKKYCKSNSISVSVSLYFLDDWLDVQKSHLNKTSPDSTFIFYYKNLTYTSLCELGFDIDPSSLDKNVPKLFVDKQDHKKYVEWEISFNFSNFKILIELDFLACPRTCENFWQISTGCKNLSYLNSKIHRSVASCYIEGGIIESASKSIYLDYFPDENFNYKHDVSGVIGMVKSECGRNGTRFYITLRPIEYFDGKLVAFGRIVEGMDTIRAISKLPTSNQRIIPDVLITNTKQYLCSAKALQD